MVNLEMGHLSALFASSKKATLLWVVTEAALCLYCFSIQAQEIELNKIHFHPNLSLKGNYQEVKENNLPITGIDAICQSSDQTVWIGTESDGLIAYSGNIIKHYRHDPKNVIAYLKNI